MFEIQAHRGNSELAVRSLLAAAPTSVEVDVGVSADGAVVVSHEVRATTVVVEAKSFPPHTVTPREFARALEPYLPRITLASFDNGVLAHARRLHRPLETTFLFEVPVRVATAARTLGPRAGLVTRDLVHAAHALGMRVVPWTVNDPREMRALIDIGVDGIATDEPALLRSVATPAAPQRLRAA